jgi:hypothetical protein
MFSGIPERTEAECRQPMICRYRTAVNASDVIDARQFSVETKTS